MQQHNLSSYLSPDFLNDFLKLHSIEKCILNQEIKVKINNLIDRNDTNNQTNYSVVPNRFRTFPYFRCNFLNFVPSDLMMMTWTEDVGARQDLVEGMFEMF